MARTPVVPPISRRALAPGIARRRLPPVPVECPVMPSSQRPRILRFSLRTLLVVVTAVAIWLGIYANHLRSQREAHRAIEELGGNTGAYVEGPEWFRNMVGDEQYFRNASRVTFIKPFNDDDLDRMIDHLNAFSRFATLDIPGTNITDDGLNHLHRLRNLEHLSLINTAISDKGLVNLEGLDSLRELHVIGTQVTADGIAKLQLALPECKIVKEW
jgi:hypothetical protein